MDMSGVARLTDRLDQDVSLFKRGADAFDRVWINSPGGSCTLRRTMKRLASAAR